MKFAALLLAVAFLFSITIGEAGQHPRQKTPEITEITLERTECFGSCPAYKIILHADGTLTYIGKANVERIGTFVARGWGHDFQHTVELIRTSHFDQFKALYGNHPFDVTTELTTVVSAGKRKTVESDYLSAPTALWAIQLVIDAETNRATGWKKVE
jgi:hypothetical protein